MASQEIGTYEKTMIKQDKNKQIVFIVYITLIEILSDVIRLNKISDSITQICSTCNLACNMSINKGFYSRKAGISCFFHRWCHTLLMHKLSEIFPSGHLNKGLIACSRQPVL